MELWTKVFGFFSEKLEHRWQHWFLNLFRNFLMIFFWQDWSPNKSGTMTDISLAFPEYIPRAWSKQKFTFLYENFVEWKFFLNLYNFSNVLRFGANMLQNVCEKFQAKLWKLISTYQKDSASKFFLLKIFFVRFQA